LVIKAEEHGGAMKENKDFQQCAERLKALADPDRLRIVTQLFGRQLNVGDLSARLGEEIVKVSHHLGVLRHAGIVEAKKKGRYVLYRLHPDVVLQDGSESDLRSINFGCCKVDLEMQAIQIPSK
jgi:DNA-binding transcriptional ArsR family regulator